MPRKKKTKKLSIIIPCWNAEPYIHELLNRLNTQVNEEMEVIVVDDGSTKPFETQYEWCRVIRKTNGGVSTARNKGLSVAQGQYIQFLDADDMIPSYYVNKMIKYIDDYHADIYELSWKTMDGKVLRKLGAGDRLPNPSVCCRCFSRDFIGDTRFNEKKDSTEDEDFTRRITYKDIDREVNVKTIPDYMYYYRSSVPMSKIKRFKNGYMNTKRVVYHYDYVTKDMTDLVEQIKHDYETNEVLLVTKRCDIPELNRYCRIMEEGTVWGHYLKGEKFDKFIQVEVPLKTQIVIYCEYANIVGGIPTFIYNFCRVMSEYYDIIFMYDTLDPLQTNRIKQVVRVMKNTGQPIACDTLILNRLTDKRPRNLYAKRVVQMCHACKQKTLPIPKDNDYLVMVSQAAKDSWGDNRGIVINNMPYKEGKDLLLLVSAMRVGAADKGKNDSRIKQLANMLEKAGIKYLWLNFSDKPLQGMPKSFINMEATLDIQSYIRKADYLVLLSDREACSMVILEALTNNTAILATPFPSLFEEGFEEGVTGYTIPFDMKFDVNKILNVPKFRFKFDTKKRVAQWREILGDTKPKKDYVPDDTVITDEIPVRVKQFYWDEQLRRNVFKGEIIHVRPKRAEELLSHKVVEIV